MDWQETLIRLYVFIAEHYKTHLWIYDQRLSNNNTPKFSDEEGLTLYLFGIMQGHTTLRAIYAYTFDHLHDWFPDLPSYTGYVQRLNRLAATFPPLIEQILAACPKDPLLSHIHLVDAMPIVMAKASRSGKACVASHIADKGYCATKTMWYYGVKLHIVAQCTDKGLPLPDYISLTGAAQHDLTALRPLLPYLTDGQLYADKSDADQTLKETLKADQNLDFYTPVKKKKDQDKIGFQDQLFSTAVSRKRQPIESLFHWLEEKTGIQRASKVRSYHGLMVHVFGRLAAACFLLAFYSLFALILDKYPEVTQAVRFFHPDNPIISTTQWRKIWKPVCKNGAIA